MRILGIDPGLDTTGYGIIEEKTHGFKLLEAGIIKTSSKEPIEKRLKKIYSGVDELIKGFRPGTVVLEKLYSHYKHPVTALLMGHSRGVVCLAAGDKDIPLVSYPATKIKKSITGNGGASKEQVQRMVQNFLGLKQTDLPLDVTDALAAAITHSNIHRTAQNIAQR